MILQALLFGSIVLIAVPSTQPAATTLRVMPVGDSLTAVPYYRRELSRLVSSSGKTIQFVGRFGDDEVGKHSGMPGTSIGQIRESLKADLDEFTPQIVLLMIGTNNMNHGLGISGPAANGYPHDETGRAVAAMKAPALKGSFLNGLGNLWGDPTYGTVYLAGEIRLSLDTILSHDPDVRVIISTIPPIGNGTPAYRVNNYNCVKRIEEFNDLIRKEVADANKRFPDRAALSDPYQKFNRDYGDIDHDFGQTVDQSADWVHPKPDARAWGLIAASFYEQLKSKTTDPAGPQQRE